MVVGQKWDAKKKCWTIPRTVRNIKELGATFLKLAPVPGASLVRTIAKSLLIEKMKAKNFCKEDIQWAKRQL